MSATDLTNSTWCLVTIAEFLPPQEILYLQRAGKRFYRDVVPMVLDRKNVRFKVTKYQLLLNMLADFSVSLQLE